MFFQWYSFVMLVHLISSIVTVLCLKSSYLKIKFTLKKNLVIFLFWKISICKGVTCNIKKLNFLISRYIQSSQFVKGSL